MRAPSLLALSLALGCGGPAASDGSDGIDATGSGDESGESESGESESGGCDGDASLEALSDPCSGGIELPQPDDFGPMGLAQCPDGNLHSYGLACCSDGLEMGACSTDEDCNEGEACICGSDLGVIFTRSPTCQPAECRTDADCGEERCGVSIGACNLIRHLACRGPEDECQSNVDCDVEAFSFCMYSADLGHWACNEEIPPPGCGP